MKTIDVDAERKRIAEECQRSVGRLHAITQGLSGAESLVAADMDSALIAMGDLCRLKVEAVAIHDHCESAD